MVELNDFIQEKKCEYKGRIYSVRDNGAIYRHSRENAKPSKFDNVWTFGRKDANTGYMLYGGVRVHQIVATAFHGTPENTNMVVDHFDTNRCNNRPENLRWVTRLENALNNPFTRNRIIYHCGSVEAFLEDPSVLRLKASDSNIDWMRTVSKEEAAKCLKNLERWNLEDRSIPQTEPRSTGGIGEWIYKDNDGLDKTLGRNPGLQAQQHDENQLALKDSLTPGSKQLHWKTPTEFPLTPTNHSETPLQDYLHNLIKGKIFCQNKYSNSEVVKAELSINKTHIAVLTINHDQDFRALTEITYEDGFFIHKSIRMFLSDEGSEKYYTLSIGKEWTGGGVIEDFC